MDDVPIEMQVEERGLMVEQVGSMEEPEMSPGLSAPRKRKGEMLMEGFMDVEEKRLKLEKTAEWEERKVAALEGIAAAQKENAKNNKVMMEAFCQFMKSFGKLAEGLNKFLEK